MGGGPFLLKADTELQSGSREPPREEAHVELVKMSRCVEEEWAREGKKQRRACLLRFSKVGLSLHRLAC